MDDWAEHFRLTPRAEIEALTEIGQVKAQILQFNTLERTTERKGLIELGLFVIA